MHIRQALDFQTTRLIADKNPIQFRTHTRSVLDQFLIDQPWLDRAKISQSRTRNLLHFSSDPKIAGAYYRPVSEIDCLFKQVGPFQSPPRLCQQLAAGIKNQIGSTDGPLMQRANE